MFSIVNRSSFEEISAFHQQILRVKDADVIPLVVVGNKCDLEKDRQVSRTEGEELARSLKCKYVEVCFMCRFHFGLFQTSAKERINIDEAFFQLVREIRGKKKGASKTKSDSKGCCLLM